MILSSDHTAISSSIIMMLTVLAHNCLLTQVHSLKYAATVDPCGTEQGQHWPNDIIPYSLSNLPGNSTVSIHQSIYEIELKTCLRYIPRTTENDYFIIRENVQCCSHKGRVGSGIHYINVHQSCATDKHQLNNLIGSAGLMVDGELQSPTHKCGCGASMYVDHVSHGSLSTPGYPNEYESGLVCLWKFWIAKGTILELEIVNFELESEVDCGYDYLQFIKQNAAFETETSYKRCGTTLNNQKLNFTAGTLSLKFNSDEDLEMKGFYMKYTTYNDKSSNILCSEFNGGCEHQCIADGNGIKQQCACHHGYALSSNGKSCEDINECLVNKGGCNQRCRNTIGSYYCQCSPQYGISQDDRHTCEVCGGELDNISGEFTSPRYPSEFPVLQNCQWTINLQPNHILRVVITNLSIPNSNRCINNYFKPQHGHFNYKRRICGDFERIEYSVNPSGGSTYFRFRTELFKYFNHTGFHLSYEQVPVTPQTTQLELDTVYVNKIEIPYATNNWLS